MRRPAVDQRLRLMAVHAHPDDESSKGAASMARYVAEGVAVLVAVATPFVAITAYGLGLGLLSKSSPDQAAILAFWNSTSGWLLLLGAVLGLVTGATIALRKSGP